MLRSQLGELGPGDLDSNRKRNVAAPIGGAWIRCAPDPGNQNTDRSHFGLTRQAQSIAGFGIDQVSSLLRQCARNVGPRCLDGPVAGDQVRLTQKVGVAHKRQHRRVFGRNRLSI